MKLEIEKAVVVSTSHITYQDSLLLNSDMYPYTCVKRPDGYGYFLHFTKDVNVPLSNSEEFILDKDKDKDKELESQFKEFSLAFRRMLFEIQKRMDDSLSWIILDRDGTVYPELETFDW